jgi:anhydro-N-acetylmuramic acid kinase
VSIAPKSKSIVVAGVMSGTSADGVDVALCRIGPRPDPDMPPRIRLVGMTSKPYPKPIRAELLRLMGGSTASAADLSRMNWRLGEIYADCVEQAALQFGAKLDLVGCHGQTIHHEASPTRHLGAKVRSTWQIGEAAVIAERLRCPVVSDFRSADLAAGGQAAPLVPMLDWCLFRSAKVSRVLQNLGGIGNLSSLPAGCNIDQLMAFDTGPGNMVIDHCMSRLFGKAYDRNGATARRGRVLHDIIASLLKQPYYSAPPPKSCGREEFGRKAGATDADCVATATALTAESVLDAYRRFVWAHLGASAPLATVEFCVAGGGAKNRTLMAMLRSGLESLGVKLRLSEELGVPAQAKEGLAFALLAWLTWNGLAGNVPSATGATRSVRLGKISWPG